MSYTTSTASTHCNLCGKPAEFPMCHLHDEYATNDIRQICGDCSDKVNKHLQALKSVSQKWYTHIFKLWMKEEKATYSKLS